MTVHAVVVVEKAVADEERRFRPIDADIRQFRPGLRRRDLHCAKSRQNDQGQQASDHVGLPKHRPAEFLAIAASD
jgi:hypothetical protein